MVHRVAYSTDLQLLGFERPPKVANRVASPFDHDAVAGSMDGHDAVVHFAAETHVDRAIADGSSERMDEGVRQETEER